MADHTEEVTLIVQNDTVKKKDSTNSNENESTLIHLCDLDSFFRNNIDLELDKITILQLEKCNISKVPDVIQNLHLKQLILRHNKLPEVPSCLYSGLKMLELLDLSHNHIKNFDIEPACSLNIVTLILNNNQIRNLPHWILTLRCPKLVELTYSHNYVISLKASHEVNVKKLELQNCQLIDEDFKFIKQVRTLEYLDIGNSKLPHSNKENHFKEIDNLFVNAKWKNFKVLILNNLMISIPPPGIFWITTITELYLINCDLSWIPEEVKYLKKLQVLDVSNNTICSLPPELCMLPDLKVVKAPHNSISRVHEFTSTLDILDLYDNDLETPVRGIDKIKLIDLEQNGFYTSLTENYEDYLEKYKNFRRIFSDDNNRINGPKEMPGESTDNLSDNDPHSSYLSEYESDDETTDNLYEYQLKTENWESWDEENLNVKPLAPKIDPEVTPSDNEWEGKENLKKISMEHKDQMHFKYILEVNEDWIFCDVEDVID